MEAAFGVFPREIPGSRRSRRLAVLLSFKPWSSGGCRRFSLHFKGFPGPSSAPSPAAPNSVYWRRKVNQETAAGGPLGRPGPSVSPLTAHLASSQRNSPLTQAAGKTTETIFLKTRSYSAMFTFPDPGDLRSWTFYQPSQAPPSASQTQAGPQAVGEARQGAEAARDALLGRVYNSGH